MSISLIGHTRQLHYLHQVIERRMLPHAYLFYGPSHVGKRSVALHIAEILDVVPLILGPDQPLRFKRDLGTQISIDYIRELKRQFSLRPPG